MSTVALGEDALFEHAPPIWVQRRLRLLKPDDLGVNRRALLFVLLGWAPLILLAIVQSTLSRTNELTPLLNEIGVHARYLVAAPLLVLAEAACAPRLNVIVRHFLDSGIVDQGDRGRFDHAVGSTRRLLREPAAEIVVIALAYLVVTTVVLSRPLDELPAWAQSRGVTPVYSPAGWWHMLVSLPLLMILCFGWMWRIALWARLLWQISRLNLRLVASHPDRCAGLSFLGHSLRAFSIVALALTAIAAGRSAHLVLAGGELPTRYFQFNIGLMMTIAALFVTPLLVFTPTLMQVWRRGTLEYGALAERVGHAFEHKWLDPRTPDQSALERPDFSATTDLYQIVSNVYAIRPVPVDLKDLITLIVAMLLPFVPVVLLTFPLDVILAQTKSLLF